MSEKSCCVRNSMVAAVFSAAVLPVESRAALDDIVILNTTSSDTPIGLPQGPDSMGELDIETACRSTNVLLGQMGYELARTGILDYVFGREPEPGDIPYLDCSEANKTEGRYTIMFSTCSMDMTDGITTMRWTVPPDAPEAQMIIADAQSGQFITGSLLETDFSQVQSFAKGREISQSVTRTAGSKTYDIQLEIGPTGNYRYSTETYVGQAYAFEYEGDFGMSGFQEIGTSFGNMKSKGTAWISAEIPGSDVVAKFYENFKTHVIPATESGTLYTAMIEQMADVVENGIPLETEQTVTMEIAGGLLGASGLGTGSTSTSRVESITVWQGAASEHQVCGHVEAPEGFQSASLDQMMSGSNMSPEDAQQMDQAMQQYQQAMDSMTDEQKQMLQQMGMGDMMQGMPGGGAPVAQQQRPAATPQPGGSAGSNMPSSEELQGGSVTESVQKHLEALGYDVGDANGEISMETTIAVSTFQAEKGMDVTGEVTPQLLGILSAEVDGRR